MKTKDMTKGNPLKLILVFAVPLFIGNIFQQLYSIVDNDPVAHPGHYTFGRIEVIDVIEDWQLGFHRGNAVKYIARAGKKDNEVQDLKKAVWYLEREISRLEKKNKA